MVFFSYTRHCPLSLCFRFSWGVKGENHKRANNDGRQLVKLGMFSGEMTLHLIHRTSRAVRADLHQYVAGGLDWLGRERRHDMWCSTRRDGSVDVREAGRADGAAAVPPPRRRPVSPVLDSKLHVANASSDSGMLGLNV
jgi:hypothetical protein